MKTFTLRGTRGARHFVSSDHIESMSINIPDPRGNVTTFVRTVSGQDFYVNFENTEAAVKFVKSWAGQVKEMDKDGPQ